MHILYIIEFNYWNELDVTIETKHFILTELDYW